MKRSSAGSASGTLLAVVMILAGCTTAEPPDSAPTSPTSGEDTPTAADGEAIPSGRLELSGWEQTHPGGTTVVLEAIEVDETNHLRLHVDVVYSGSRSSIDLASLSTFLLDDTGVQHDAITPDDNSDLELPVDSRMTANLAFHEPVPPAARRVTLAVNASGSSIRDVDDGSDTIFRPGFAFEDIPLPGVGLDAEADRGDTQDPTVTATVDTDISQTHVSGVTVVVTRIATDGRTVHIDIEAENPTDREVRLASRVPQLTDTQGSSFTFLRPESDDRLEASVEVPAGGEASATFAWRGTVPGDATGLTLRINRERTIDDPDTSYPGLVFDDLPIPGKDDEGNADDE